VCVSKKLTTKNITSKHHIIMKKTARFSKGQTVFQATTLLCSDNQKGIAFSAVIERIVDACGQKKLTFFNRSERCDSIFGRSKHPEQQQLFSDAESAFRYLEEQAIKDAACAADKHWVRIKDYRVASEIFSDDRNDLQDFCAALRDAAL
jgi:hypothetical protein